MKKKIIDTLDNLTIEQVEGLLDEPIEMKINKKSRHRIKKATFKKIGSNKVKRIYIPKKLVACVAAIAIICTGLSIVGIDNVAAAINKLFTFIPGVGIKEKSDEIVYAIAPIEEQIRAGDMKANIVNAVYMDNCMNIIVQVRGKAVYHDGFAIYVNKEPIGLEDESYSLSIASDSTMMNISYETEAPLKDDIYEIAVAGFSEPLSFKMIPCRDYEEIMQIGPSDVHNGISIVTMTSKIEDHLIVWCYPLRASNATQDTIMGYGQFEKYIETKNGQIFSNVGGWHLRDRLIFDMPESYEDATLHIPYLTMMRNEKDKLNINLPKNHTSEERDISLENTLGTIRVTEVRREPNVHESDKDTIFVKLAFDSNDQSKKLHSFEYEVAGKYIPNARHYDSDGGLEYIELYVDKNVSEVSLEITDLCYWLFGEYVIPLELP